MADDEWKAAPRTRLVEDPGPDPASSFDRMDEWKPLPVSARVLLFGLATGLVVTAARLPGASGIALGLVLGFLVSSRVRPFISIALPFEELGRAAAPLLLPLLVLIVIATFQLPLETQAVIGVAVTMIAWLAIIRPDLKRLQLAPLSAKDLVFPLLVAAVVLVVFIWKHHHVQQFETRGGLSSFLLLLTLVLWAIAIVCRLLSFGVSWLRLGVALVLILAVARVAMDVGTFPYGAWIDHQLPLLSAMHLAIFAGLVVVAELVVEWVRALIEERSRLEKRISRLLARALNTGPPKTFSRSTAVLGLAFALLATATAGAAAVAGLSETSKTGFDRVRLAIPRLAPPVIETNRAADDLGRDIARRYFPVLAFSDAEQWAPQSVTSYVKRARLDGPRLTPPWKPGRRLPRSCHSLAPAPCFKLTIRCAELGRDKCAPEHPHQHGQLQREGAVYVRVLPWRPLPRDGSGDVFVKKGPFSDQLRILVQYWFFYPYDRWTAPLFAGRLTQEHEGDWEAVTLGLADPWKPLFLAYSAHCGGHWKRWSEVEKADRAQQHPLIAVATGSQANYPKADTHRPPDWTSCKNLPSGATSLLTYALNVRDTTAYDWEWYPSRLIPVDGKTAPMSFPGRWGKDERIVFTNFKRHPFEPGVAPATPTYQPLWKQPVQTIFCGRYEPRDCSAQTAGG
jgi:hypothetical protein